MYTRPQVMMNKKGSLRCATCVMPGKELSIQQSLHETLETAVGLNLHMKSRSGWYAEKDPTLADLLQANQVPLVATAGKRSKPF